MCSSIFAQTNFITLRQIETEMNSLNNNTNSTIFFVPDNVVAHKYSFLNLSGQALTGSALAIAFAIPPFTVAWARALGMAQSSKSLDTALGILTLASYTFGSAVGVHWVAKSQNSKLSFWGTVGYSVIGSGVGAVLLAVLASRYETIPEFGGSIAALCPIIASMIYASFISDWPQEPQKISFAENSLTQKDLFEYSKLFNIELFRVKL